MKRASSSLSALTVLVGVTLAAAGMYVVDNTPKNEPAKSPKKDAVAAALDTLEQQLQRHFHDRNNISFGYERVIRMDARRHNTVVLNQRKGQLVGDNGKPMDTRVVNNRQEFEVAPGRWVDYSQLKETMHPENDEEKQAMETLRTVDVAIYTAGIFDEAGKTGRVKGPAYLRQSSGEAPSKESLAAIANQAWISTSDVREIRTGGWSHRVVKVKADDKSCITCHSDPWRGGDRNKRTDTNQKDAVKAKLKIGDGVGVFIIATKLK